jgi:hypothetical protein
LATPELRSWLVVSVLGRERIRSGTDACNVSGRHSDQSMRPTRRLRLLGAALVAAVALGLGASGASSLASDQAPKAQLRSAAVARAVPVRGLLVVGRGPVTIVSLAGERRRVPARVSESPFGVSPDVRMIAAVSGTKTKRAYETAGVLVGVQGGPMKVVLRGDCAAEVCPYGADPRFAWSPDSSWLAVSAEPQNGPTLLKLANAKGRVVRSIKLPPTVRDPERRQYHRPISWSPDGSQLLLERSNMFGTEAVLALDVKTGRLRMLLRLGGSICDNPRLAWSLDGRFVALTSSGTQDCYDRFAIVNTVTERPVINRRYDKGTFALPVWAPDGRSVLLQKRSGGIDRYYLASRRTERFSSDGSLWLTLPNGVVHSPRQGSRDVLQLVDLSTGRRTSLLASQTGISAIRAVLPLSRLP